MRKNAVLFTVLFALVVTLLSVSAVFWEFNKLNKKQHIDSIFTKDAVLIQIYGEHTQKESSDIMLEANLAVYKFRLEKDEDERKIILEKGTVLKQKAYKKEALLVKRQDLLSLEKVKSLRISMLEYQHTIFFYIQSPQGNSLIHDEELRPYKPWNILYSYMIIIVILSIAFMLILQKLKPLTRLRRDIAKYGDGDMNISFQTDAKDEIGLIVNELENTRLKINSLLESRTLFLRNVMHELKTPIAKGTIATQMLDSQKQIDRFTSIFGRLESLVGEFALIEEVTSLSDKKDFKEYRLVDIIDGAIDMAMIDNEQISVGIVYSTKIFVNYRLYTTAVKNMIDNGIKYSTDKHITIVFKNDELCFESRGECLKHPLTYYIEPFTKDNPSKNSFGLGLYLVDSILKSHDKVLAHEYEDGVNRFIFV
ncbi:HAMP domain-containing histidine kinase [Sulfurimonas sp. SAG-AH-194-I05]|nr:ArsS family sensor histidine kinase [Sulfurimonas sp. SAG-AH-194-I05]MDF1874982.1 HAMP domain-containing histidine kinase [Sulfurimonas sp. SAG-AH-194-I05]